jgi:hypothetical protein
MAYSLHYIGQFPNIHNNELRVSIYEDGWAGTGYEYLTLKFRSVKVKYNWRGWEEPIIGQSASFVIINDKDNFFDLLPLMTAEERKYLVVITELDKGPNKMLFRGFLDCKDIEQPYLQRQEIRLNASGYLSKLQYIDASTIETLENDTFINILLECLGEIDADPVSYGIRVNTSLYSIGASMSSGQTFLNKTGIYKEMFWKDNIKRDSALEVINKILSAFNCYLYWYNDYYYIERYEDIWDTSPTWVQYIGGTEYWPTDTASTQGDTKTITDFVDLKKIETSQKIKVIPGKKIVEVNIHQDLLFNHVLNNFEDGRLTDADAIFPEQDPPQDTELPDIRQWLFHGGDSSGGPITWSLQGHPFRNISKAVRRDGWAVDSDYSLHRGMHTQFWATITGQSSMTIKFKVGTQTNPFTGGDPEEYTTHFPISLMIDLPTQYFANRIGEDWSATYHAWWDTRDALEIIDVPGSSWDERLWTCDVEITIPFHEFTNSAAFYAGNNRLCLTIGTPTADQGGVAAPFPHIYIGDVEVSVDIPLEDNFIKGDVNTKFLDKLTVEQYLSDWDNLAIKNGIWYGAETSADPDALDVRTDLWDDDFSSSAEGLDLAEMKIKSKFRIYNKSRQKITTKIRADEEFYRPLSLFEDGNQQDSTGDPDRPVFVLVGYEYELQGDEMNIILSEYDNQEDINLI